MWRLKTTEQTAKRAYQALGRKRKGELNKTELAYQNYLQDRKNNGGILDFGYEEIKFKVGEPACWFCPDFWVLTPRMEIQFHEVKGAKAVFQDDSKVKIKACAYRYPFVFKVVYPDKKEPTGWLFEEV